MGHPGFPRVGDGSRLPRTGYALARVCACVSALCRAAAGLVIWPLWFAMDFQGAASAEIAALQTRQQYLATLATQRCGNALTQINPNFYDGYRGFTPGTPLAQINPR